MGWRSSGSGWKPPEVPALGQQSSLLPPPHQVTEIPGKPPVSPHRSLHEPLCFLGLFSTLFVSFFKFRSKDLGYLPSETVSLLRKAFWTEDQDFLTSSLWLPMPQGHSSAPSSGWCCQEGTCWSGTLVPQHPLEPCLVLAGPEPFGQVAAGPGNPLLG